MPTYKYARPAVTVDAVLFSEQSNQWQVLLIQRKNPPFQDMWALPGGFIDENEAPQNAAARELEEETTLKGIELHELGFFGEPKRDPRDHTVSLVYWAIVEAENLQPQAADDAKNIAWFPLHELPELAFDHNKVIHAGRRKAQI